MGQADGVQCRTVEIFESLGLAEELLRESYHVLEVSFWSSDDKGGIIRTNRAADTEPGLSHMPHVILNQARVNGLLTEAMTRFGGQKVDYGYEVQSVRVNNMGEESQGVYPVTVVGKRNEVQEIFQAKYVLVCESGSGKIVQD
jgi:phenol 2-monooxygenase